MTLNPDVMARVTRTVQTWSDTTLYNAQSSPDRELDIPELTAAVRAEVRRRENREHWARFGKQAGVPDADMGAWTTFVATHDYDDLNDAYAAWCSSRRSG